MSNNGVCYNCFHSKPAGTSKCPRCGYDDSNARENYPLALPHGSILGKRYVVGRVLGQGGFGITYLAQDYSTKQLVAIKEYMPHSMAVRSHGPAVTAYSGQQGANFQYGKDCFLTEAQTLSSLAGNTSVVRIHTYFEENNTAYLVMDYVRGESFLQYIKQRGGRIPWNEAHRILLPVIDALASVHAKGLIHRDVTPDNIYITKDGSIKLLDFGAARYSLGDQTHSLSVILKHGFAPREQYARHGKQGPYTDVYSVAASYYYAVTGRRPPDSIDRLDDDTLATPSALKINIPVGVENAILKGLSVQAEDRYQTMAEFRAALEPNAKAAPTNSVRPQTPPPVNNQPPEPGLQPVTAPQKKGGKGLAIGLGVGIPAFLLVMVLIIVLAVSGSDSGTTINDVPGATTSSSITYTVNAITPGYYHTVGIRTDNTVVAIGDNTYGQCNVSEWTDIDAIAAGEYHTVGLRSDGTVVAVGRNSSDQCDVSGWTDIVAISAGDNNTVGLKSDGTVVAVGDNYYGQCDVQDWTDITKIAAGPDVTLGLKSDGTVVAVGACDDRGKGDGVSEWTDIVDIAVCRGFSAGLKSDGTVVTTFGYVGAYSWTNVVEIALGANHIVGLRANGTLVSSDGDVDACTDVVAIAAKGDKTIVAFADGTIMSVGSNNYGELELDNWLFRQ